MTPRPDFVQLRRYTLGTKFVPLPKDAQGRTPVSIQDERHPGFETTSMSGSACETASDKAACQQALADQDGAEQGFHRECIGMEGCWTHYLVTTRGDEVRSHCTRASLKEWLGPIDTEQKAVLLAFAHGHDVCHDGPRPAIIGGNPRDGFVLRTTLSYADCVGTTTSLQYVRISPGGEVLNSEPIIVKHGTESCYPGRRPAGLQDARPGAWADARGRFFAESARMEAASIHAFLRLREELALHGADQVLLDAALASAADEVRHAEVTRQLAVRYGAIPAPPEVLALPLRDLREVLLDNTVEGCVRETYGALLAHHQAMHARDPEVREAMAVIAEDETRHAALSWDIDAWARSRLSSEDQRMLVQARTQAIAVLRAEVAVPLDAELSADAGLPSPEVAAALVASLEQELWV